MSNVIEFKPRPSKPEDPMAELEARGKRFWHEVIVQIQQDLPAPFPFIDAIAGVRNSPYMSEFRDTYWAHAEPVLKVVDVGTLEDFEATFQVVSNIRPTMVPEFGEQDNLTFLVMRAKNARDDIKTTETPDDLFDMFEDYLDSFGETHTSDMRDIGQAILAGLIEHRGLQYIQASIQQSSFHAWFYDDAKKLAYSFAFNFLALLLDDVAIKTLAPPE